MLGDPRAYLTLRRTFIVFIRTSVYANDYEKPLTRASFEFADINGICQLFMFFFPLGQYQRRADFTASDLLFRHFMPKGWRIAHFATKAKSCRPRLTKTDI